MFYPELHWSERVRVASAIESTDDERAELTKLSRSGRTSVRLAQRAGIVLLAAKGMQKKDIAEQLGVVARRWRAGASAGTDAPQCGHRAEGLSRASCEAV